MAAFIHTICSMPLTLFMSTIYSQSANQLCKNPTAVYMGLEAEFDHHIHIMQLYVLSRRSEIE